MKRFKFYNWRVYSILLLVLLFVAAPAATLAQGLNPHLVVNVSWLNVRTGPGVSNSILTTVPGGTVLPVTGIDNGRVWFQVTSPAGTGWVNSTHAIDRGSFRAVPILNSNTLQELDIPYGAPHLVVNTYRLNVRSGPGVSHSIIGKVSGGDKLAILAIDSGGLWYQVQTSVGPGWVNSHYAALRGNASDIPRTSSGAPTGPAIAPGAPHLVVNTAFLNVRSGPGVNYNIIATASGGAKLPVLAISSSNRLWHQVDTGAGIGWVNSYYAVRRGDFSGLTTSASPGTYEVPGANLTGPTPRAVVNTHRLNIRSQPSASSSIITSVPGGTTLAIHGISLNRNWYLVEGSFGRGWLNNYYVVFRGDISRVPTIA